MARCRIWRWPSIWHSWPVVDEPARTEHGARQRYIDFLSLPLHCITNAIWVATPPLAGPGGIWSLSISGKKGGDPIPLRRDDGTAIYMTALQRFKPTQTQSTGAWRMPTVEYNYTIWEPSLDRTQKPVMQWHFHPDSGTTKLPHLHVRASETMCGITTRKLHIPSERVAFESIVRFAVEELGVRPRQYDWEVRIQEALDAFIKFRTWTTEPPVEDREA